MKVAFIIIFWLFAMASCGRRKEPLQGFAPRQEFNLKEPIKPQPTAAHLALAKEVFLTLKRDRAGTWIAEKKLALWGRLFDFDIVAEAEMLPEEYIQRLAGTLSIIESLQGPIVGCLQGYYEQNKQFIETQMGVKVGPVVSHPSELWSIMGITVLEFNSHHESMSEVGELNPELNDGTLFCLYGALPWAEEDGVVVSVSRHKIVVDSTASLVY